MMTPERLRAIQERCRRATKGPWGVRHLCSGCTPEDDESAGLGLELVGPPQPWLEGQFARAADAQFAAHARDDVPALVEEVGRWWAFRERLEELMKHWQDDPHRAGCAAALKALMAELGLDVAQRSLPQ